MKMVVLKAFGLEIVSIGPMHTFGDIGRRGLAREIHLQRTIFPRWRRCMFGSTHYP
jgi:hypothetical protein